MNNVSEHLDWYQAMRREFSDRGICYADGDLVFEPIVVDSSITAAWERDIPWLVERARDIALVSPMWQSSLRHDWRSAVDDYSRPPSLPIVMRPDGIIQKGELKIIDLNVDSGIGGVVEVERLQEHMASNPLLVNRNIILPSPRCAYLDLVKELALLSATKKGEPVRIGLVGFNDFDRYNQDISNELCSWINELEGIDAVVVAPEMLWQVDGMMSDGIAPFDILYREGALVHTPDRIRSMIQIIRDTARTRTVMFSDPKDLLLDSKASLAFLSELLEKPASVDDIRVLDLVERYIPWTRFVRPGIVKFCEQQVDLRELLTDGREMFVLKQLHSHAGKNVIIGSETQHSWWVECVDRALASHGLWVVQEILASSKEEFTYFNSEHNEVVSVLRRYTVSPFFFGVRMGGALVRLEKDPDRRLLSLPTTSEMGATGFAIRQMEGY